MMKAWHTIAAIIALAIAAFVISSYSEILAGPAQTEPLAAIGTSNPGHNIEVLESEPEIVTPSTPALTPGKKHHFFDIGMQSREEILTLLVRAEELAGEKLPGSTRRSLSFSTNRT